MKLTNKVTNLFFAFFAAVGLFMPIVGYKTMLMGQEYSLLDMIKLLKDYDPSKGQTLLGNLDKYGYKVIAIATLICFIAMLVFLLVSIILSFTNVPYLAMCIVTFLGFASYVSASVLFCRIGAGFVNLAISLLGSFIMVGPVVIGILSVIQGIRMLTMTPAEFDAHYVQSRDFYPF